MRKPTGRMQHRLAHRRPCADLLVFIPLLSLCCPKTEVAANLGVASVSRREVLVNQGPAALCWDSEGLQVAGAERCRGLGS